MDENTTKIILAVLAIIAAIIGGSFIAIRISKHRNNKVNQNNITIPGSNNKITGGDDNSIS